MVFRWFNAPDICFCRAWKVVLFRLGYSIDSVLNSDYNLAGAERTGNECGHFVCCCQLVNSHNSGVSTEEEYE